MIRWPSLAPVGPPEAVQPIDLSLDEASRPLEPFAPVAVARQTEEGRGALELAVVPEAATGRAPARTARNLLALAASVAAHVALAAVLGYAAMPEGVEADLEAISVEIVLEPVSDVSRTPSVAGEGGETAEESEPAEVPQTVEASTVLPEEPEQAVEAVGPVEAEATQPVAAEAAEPIEEASISMEYAGEPMTAEEQAIEARPARAVTDILPDFQPLDPPTDIAFATEPVVPPTPPEPAVTGERTEEVAEALDQPSLAPPVLAAPPSFQDMLPPITAPLPPRLPEMVLEQPQASVAVPSPAAAKTKPQRPTKSSSSKPDRNSAKAAKARSPERVAKKTEVVRKPVRAEKAETAREKQATRKTAQASRAQAGAAASAKASAGAMESYGRTVNRHVQRYKRYPAEAARAGMKGAVRLSISIGGSGNLAAARVTGSSGHAPLDSEALATVRRAAPYPRPPSGGKAQFSLTLRYSR